MQIEVSQIVLLNIWKRNEISQAYRGPMSKPMKFTSGWLSWGIITLSWILMIGGLYKKHSCLIANTRINVDNTIKFRQSLSPVSARQWYLRAIILGVLIWGFAGLRCFACQLCENMQFALRAICACWVLLFTPSPPSLLLATLVCRMVSIYVDSVSVMVPGGCCSQGCHGYLHSQGSYLGSIIPKTPFPKLSNWQWVWNTKQFATFWCTKISWQSVNLWMTTLLGVSVLQKYPSWTHVNWEVSALEQSFSLRKDFILECLS